MRKIFFKFCVLLKESDEVISLNSFLFLTYLLFSIFLIGILQMKEEFWSESSWIHGFLMKWHILLTLQLRFFFISSRSMRQTSQPSGAEKKEAMKQAFKANSSRSSRGGQDTQSAKTEKAEKADVSSKKPTGTSTSSLRYRPFNFLLIFCCQTFKRLSKVFHYIL